MASDLTKRLLILHTGGTLGMDLNGVPLSKETFFKALQDLVPQAFHLAHIEVEMLFSKDSSDITPLDWVHIGERLHDNLNKFDAFVLTHGTDTMAFTASALSFMFEGLNKSVILTGSQRPLKDPRSDAPRNILNAIQIAVDAKIHEVCIFFDSLLLRGNRSKKLSIPSFRAFESPNHSPLAVVGSHTEYAQNYVSPLSAVYRFDPRIDTRVVSIPVFPGLDMDHFSGLLNKPIRCVVIEAFGPGDIPRATESVVRFLTALRERKIPAIVSSQAISGRVDLSIYETGRAARDAGAIAALDMTWEAALLKSMFMMGRGVSYEDFEKEFHRNWAGEVNVG